MVAVKSASQSDVEIVILVTSLVTNAKSSSVVCLVNSAFPLNYVGAHEGDAANEATVLYYSKDRK